MFSGPQYVATGQRLLTVFPAKPKSTPDLRIDNRFIYNELDRINKIRNRIAHHEPICFLEHTNIKTDFLPVKSMTGSINCFFGTGRERPPLWH